MPDRILAETRYLRLIDRDGWAFVERPQGSTVVAIVAVTDDRRLVMVEQVRAPLRREVIELPAGLVGDEVVGEAAITAAARELEEETGYRAARLEALATCPSSAGMTSELVTFFLATGLQKVGPGGGTPEENIRVHEVPLSELRAWLAARDRAGVPIAAKLYAGLFFIADQIPTAGTAHAAGTTGTGR